MPMHMAPGRSKKGGLVRQRTHVGKRANKKNLVKTTRRGAYKKSRKKQMAIRRAPLVETLKYQSHSVTHHSQVLSRTNAFNNFLNYAFVAGYRQNLDVPNDGVSTEAGQGPTCRGRDIYSKVTAMKFKFTFPQNIFSIRTPYTPPELIWGWLKKTAFLTSSTSPSVGNATQAYYLDMIQHALIAQFNEKSDKLDFTDRRPTEYKILGRRKIRPNRNRAINQFQDGITNHAIVAASQDFPNPGDNTSMLPVAASGDPNPGSMSVLASVPPVFHTIRWNVNRKIGLQQADNWEGTGTGAEARFVPSDCWIPFAIVFNPSYALQVDDTRSGAGEGTAGQILVNTNSVHYYTDS